ncbi:MAG: Lrp/AsnC family transcriptional regulator [Candidatus Hecatellaceae archaeon]
MPIAFVLLTVRPGSEEKVVNDLKKIPSVKRVFRICGPYDILAELEIEDLSTLKEVVEEKIRKIPENRSSLTMVALES